MNRCPNCNGSIIRLGNKEKPFLCKTCNKWFSNEEVTPKQTNADKIRAMTDKELAELIGDNIDCSICKKEVFETTTCPGSITAEGEDCYGCWLDWLKEEATE